MDLRITLKTLCDGMQKTPLVAAAAPKHCVWTVPHERCLKKKSVFNLVQIFRCLRIDSELVTIRYRAREMLEWIKNLPRKLESYLEF